MSALTTYNGLDYGYARSGGGGGCTWKSGYNPETLARKKAERAAIRATRAKEARVAAKKARVNGAILLQMAAMQETLNAMAALIAAHYASHTP